MIPRPGGRALTTYAAVVQKEFRQTLRDRRIMFMLVAAPLIQTILFGFAVDFDVDRVPTAIADLDRSGASREHARRHESDIVRTDAAEFADGIANGRLKRCRLGVRLGRLGLQFELVAVAGARDNTAQA